MNFYPFNIGDYSAATRHLTWEEDLAYRRLIDAYYTREEPIPSDPRMAYRLVLATTESQREAVDVVLQEYFQQTSEGWVHHRCEEEIFRANEKKAKASHSAQARWRMEQERNQALHQQDDEHSERNASADANASDVNANASNDVCEGNAPNPNPNPNPKVNKRAAPEGFLEFWNAYPSKVGKGAAEAAWKRHRPSLSDCLAAIAIQQKSKKWIEGYIPNPATWINQRRWEDEAHSAAVVPMQRKCRLNHLGFVEEFVTSAGIKGWSVTEYHSLEEYEAARGVAA